MRRVVALALFSTLALFGCGDATPTPSLDLEGGDGALETCTPDGQPIVMTGRYAMKVDLLLRLKVVAGCEGAACLVDADSAGSALVLVDAAQSGQAATLSATLCALGVPPLQFKAQATPVTVTVSPAVLATAMPANATASLDGTQTCAGLTTDPLTFTLGARLADKVNDPLPGYTVNALPPLVMCDGSASTACTATSATGCICDQDGDGKPGATFGTTNTPGVDDIDAIYVDQRISLSLRGQVYPRAAEATGPRMKGTIPSVKFDQNVLGCHRATAQAGGPRDCDKVDNVIVSSFGPAATLSTARPSTFSAVPVAAGFDCAALRAQAATLF